jgi:hypothetical protein
VVIATPLPLYYRERDPVPIIWESGWVSRPVWTGAKTLAPLGFDSRTFQPVASRYNISYYYYYYYYYHHHHHHHHYVFLFICHCPFLFVLVCTTVRTFNSSVANLALPWDLCLCYRSVVGTAPPLPPPSPSPRAAIVDSISSHQVRMLRKISTYTRILKIHTTRVKMRWCAFSKPLGLASSVACPVWTLVLWTLQGSNYFLGTSLCFRNIQRKATDTVEGLR